MTSSTETGHECESWQMRRGPDGLRYCAACGAPVAPREGTPEQLARLLADIHLMELEEELDEHND